MTIKLICEDCKKSRRTSGGKLICTTIGDPLLAYKYGKCRRFERRVSTTAKTTDKNLDLNLFD